MRVVNQMDLFATGNPYRIRYIAGYSWGGARHPAFTWGVLCTPKWARDCARTHPEGMMWLDNGAYTDYISGIVPCRDEHVSRHIAAGKWAKHLAAVVLPDVVGDPVESWQRTVAAAPKWKASKPNARRFYAIQRGIDASAVVSAVKCDGYAGVFVGGDTIRWKLDTVKEVRALDGSVWIHVGRLSRLGHLTAGGEYGMDSFDSTSLEREQFYNLRSDRAQLLEATCQPAPAPRTYRAWRK